MTDLSKYSLFQKTLSCVASIFSLFDGMTFIKVHLGQGNNLSLFFGIKGHVVFLPQDSTCLIDLLPISPTSLSDIVKVVWTRKSKPDRLYHCILYC